MARPRAGAQSAATTSPMHDQLNLLHDSAADWWEYNNGASTVFIRAANATEARAKAEAHLRDLGILPGGPPGLHESFERMCEFARRGRR